MLIGIDHGNRLIKLARREPFTCGLVESDIAPFGTEILKYKGKFYQLSDQRIPYHRDKTEDDRYFVLTLFAIAKEIEAAGVYRPGVIPVQLAVGLPPAYYGAQKPAFISYFSKRGSISFSYHGKQYTIMISEVLCFPQAYAAAVTMYATLCSIPQAIILDLGGYTADYIRVKSGAGDLTVCDSLEKGVILYYNKVQSKLRAEQDLLLSEMEIDAIMVGKQLNVSDAVIDIVANQAQEYITDLLNTFREHQIELKSGPVIFVGGGAQLFKEQIKKSGKVATPIFVDDIRANASGYEKMYELMRKGR